MCGIIFRLCRKPPPLSPPSSSSSSASAAPAEDIAHLESLIRARGPDSFRTIQRKIHPTNSADPDLHLTFSASVLALRSSRPVVQPLVDETTGSILMWNGEAWKFRGEVVTENDTQLVFDVLLAAVAGCADMIGRGQAVRDVLKDVMGPYAFLFYDAPNQRALYGRDPVGRRSLLTTQMVDGDVCIASVSDARTESAWKEVQTGGIYEIDLTQAMAGYVERFIPWADSTENFFPRLNRRIDFPSDYTRPSSDAVHELQTRFESSMLLRTCKTAPWLDSDVNHDQFAVLFSGGVDCTLLAFMLDRVLPLKHTIDLLNVAFENPRVVAAAMKQTQKDEILVGESSDTVYDTCPDRKTGLSSYEELCRLCPKRKWQFVAINISYRDTVAHKPFVTALMHPHSTEMDLSISLALFFASRGQGEIQEAGGKKPYLTQAKILFSGLGADEVFGGYTRHAKAFAYSGIVGLLNELDLDFGRLAERNLGRDDRVVSHWGREIRYPYLDEDLTSWALALPIWEKCGFVSHSKNKPACSEPGKLLLRIVASQCGLIAASAEKKRAIQFGARTAKMTVGRTKGTDAIKP